MKIWIPPVIYFAGIYAMFISILITPFIIYWTKKKKLLDTPNHRTSHITPTPTLGGVGIFIASVSSILTWYWGQMTFPSEVPVFIGTITVLFIVGLRDDLVEIRASRKLFIQLSLSFIIAYSGIRITSLHGLLGIYEINIFYQYALTILVIAGITNALNLLDGINGLAGGISFINLVVFTLLFLQNENLAFAIVAASLAGGVLGFLRYNFNRAKIFMGDTGSLVLGFSLAVLAIKFLHVGSHNGNPSMIIVVGIMILPVFDTIRVFVQRIVSGGSPFKADKTHIHHLLLKLGLSHLGSSLVLYAANLVLIGLAILLNTTSVDLKSSIVLIVVLATWLTELITIVKLGRSGGEHKKLLNMEQELTAQNVLLKKNV